jgi:hypothetical protein
MIAAAKDKEKNAIAAKNAIKILDNSKCFLYLQTRTRCDL